MCVCVRVSKRVRVRVRVRVCTRAYSCVRIYRACGKVIQPRTHLGS